MHIPDLEMTAVESWANGALDGAEPDVLESVLRRAAEFPSKTAVKDERSALTYGDLGDAIVSVATGLRERGTQPGDRIALWLPNSVDYVVSALACLAVDAAFVPLSVTDPAPRVAAIIADCRPRLVIAASPPTDTPAPPGSVPVDELRSRGGGPIRGSGAEVPAYLIYTSGTTGAPKGVVIGRRAFAASIQSTAEIVGFGPAGRSMSVSAYHFDGSFGTLFGTIASGGFLLIPPRESLLFPRFFLHAVADEGITATSFSPSYLRMLLASKRFVGIGSSDLRTLALGGEACSAQDVGRLRALAPRVAVFNQYGPTESTIAASHHLITDEDIARGGTVPIGRPHRGVSFYRVAESGELIDDPATPGELYIGGVQLMDGYWNAPALTASVVRADVIPGERVYRTGDIVMASEAGEYTYRGRIGSVIKRNGVRISLVELAEVLQATEGVATSACTTYDNCGDLGIVGFVVPRPGVTIEEIRRRYGERLPATMMPDLLQTVDVLPLTPAKKVDERALLAAVGLSRPQATPST